MTRKTKGLLISLGGFIPLQIYFIISWLPQFLEFSSGIKNLDSRFIYSVEDVNALLATLGESGVNFYFKGIFIDSVYAVFMALVVFFILKIARSGKYSYFLPAIYLISDWIENIGIITYLNSFPEFIITASVFPLFSSIKHSMAIVTLIFLVVQLFKKIKK